MRVPGLVDIQVNGAAGIDLTTEPHRLWEVAAALPAYGVVAFVPTIITSDPAAREAALAAFRAGPPAGWAGACWPLPCQEVLHPAAHRAGPKPSKSHVVAKKPLGRHRM